MFRLIHATAAFAVTLSLGACGFFETLDSLESRSFTFEPTLEGVHQVARRYNAGVCPGVFLHRGGRSQMLADWVARGDIAGAGLLVGYSSVVVPGADPLPCNFWVQNAFQGKTFWVFDELPAGTIVESARLTFAATSVPVLDSGTPSNPCRFRVGTATGLSTSAYSLRSDPAEQIFTRPTRPGNVVAGNVVDVTSTVARWVNRGTSDNWIVFSIEDGRAFVEHDEQDRIAYCALNVDGIELEVVALVPPGP